MIRVFPRRTKWTPTDSLAFVGYPPLMLPPDQPVRVSVTFTWDIEEGLRLAEAWKGYYSDVQIGGPAFGNKGGEFTPGMFVKRGVVITSRGCPKRCPWCFVPEREGRIREYPITIGEIIQDNNLLACSPRHIIKVFKMLQRNGKAATFSGGIDTTLLKPWHRKLFDRIKIKEMWFACDSKGAIPLLENAAKILEGISQNKKRCYVMVGFGEETLAEAEQRLKTVFDLDFLPFCQLYKGKGQREYSQEWLDLNRKWSRPAIYRSKGPKENTQANLEF